MTRRQLLDGVTINTGGGHLPVDLSDALAIYDGRAQLGFVVLDAGSFHAFDLREDYLGAFNTSPDAVAALRASARQSEVGR